MRRILEIIKAVAMQVLEFIKAMAIGLLASVAVAAFVFAGESYESRDRLSAIVTTGLLAMALLVVQTTDWKTLHPRAWHWPRDWNLRRALKTLIVGVAIHYSAMIIGVSFGAVFSEEGTSVWPMVAVLVKQTILTGAAWILVNEYRKSNTANHQKAKHQGGEQMPVLIAFPAAIVLWVLAAAFF